MAAPTNSLGDELVDCPLCEDPLDPAALPHHPVHDFTDEDLATLAAADQARESKAEAMAWAKLRAAQQAARRARSRKRAKR